MLTGMAKPMPTLPPERERIALLIPTTSPDMLTRGPPELPGLIAASVCRKSSKGPWPIERPLALMMPAVTVCWRPKGDPMASTQSPTLILSESPERGGREGAAALEAEHREIRPPVHSGDLRLVLLAVGGRHLDLARPLDHVGVGEHGARRDRRSRRSRGCGPARGVRACRRRSAGRTRRRRTPRSGCGPRRG